MRCISLAASSECPPNSKKLSRTPIGFLPSTSSQILTNCAWKASVAEAIASDLTSTSGTGSPRRLILPFGVNGMACSRTKVEGTM